MITLCSSLLSGIIAAIITLLVTSYMQKKKQRYDYKLQIFSKLIAYRLDLSDGVSPTGFFQEAINQVFIAFNDNKNVIAAFEEFRKATQYRQNIISESDKVIDSLLILLKAMAKDLSIDYSFSNDDLFTRPIQIRPH